MGSLRLGAASSSAARASSASPSSHPAARPTSTSTRTPCAAPRGLSEVIEPWGNPMGVCRAARLHLHAHTLRG